MRGRGVLFVVVGPCVCFIVGYRVAPSRVDLKQFKNDYLQAYIACQQNGVQEQGVWQIMVIIWKYG